MTKTKGAKTKARAAACPELDELLTIADIAAWWRVDRSTFHRWRTQPDFPKPIIIGSSMRWWRSELRIYLDAHRAKSAIAPVTVGIVRAKRSQSQIRE